MNSKAQSGFTLWELLVTVLVIGVILGLGVPNLMEFQRNNAMASTANEFITAVLASRAEAIKRRVPVTLCASADPLADPPACIPDGAGTNGGFIVWVDENGNALANGAPDLNDATDGNGVVNNNEPVLRRIEAPGGQIDIFMDNGHISFGPNGFPRTIAGLGQPVTRILYCDDRGRGSAAGGLSSARGIQVLATGRAEVLRELNQVNAVITDLTNAGVMVSCP